MKKNSGEGIGVLSTAGERKHVQGDARERTQGTGRVAEITFRKVAMACTI